MFFHLIHNLYEHTTIILTSNRSPELWSTLTDDPATITAILDRLLHRSEIVKMEGDSFRMNHQMNIFANESVKVYLAIFIRYYLTPKSVNQTISFRI